MAKVHLEPELSIKDNYGFKSQEVWDETFNQ